MEETINHKSNHFPRINFVLISLIALIGGGSIYILFRPVEAKFFNWFTIIESRNWLFIIREESLSVIGFLPPWILYSLPNGLWAFAYTLIIMYLWTRSKSLMKYFWFGSIPVLVFGFEILQLIGQTKVVERIRLRKVSFQDEQNQYNEFLINSHVRRKFHNNS